MAEQTWMQLALAAYALSGLLAVAAWRVAVAASGERAAVLSARLPQALLVLVLLAVALHTGALLTRWFALGHGPFTTMYEILSSNLWSLSLVYLVSASFLAPLRRLWLLVLPVPATLALWMLLADARPGHLPPTYDTVLLYLHTVVGKLFLGLLLTALALGLVPLLRLSAWGRRVCTGLPDERRCDMLAHRYAAYAFVAELAMLIVGAVWAQDAWGRYWGWDPLETWAFVTWLALAMLLHQRATFRPSAARFGAGLVVVFVLAFLTFFGVPFLSTSPHQGAI